MKYYIRSYGVCDCGMLITQVFDENAEWFEGNPVDYPVAEYCPLCNPEEDLDEYYSD